jgi:hypothetical protein
MDITKIIQDLMAYGATADGISCYHHLMRKDCKLMKSYGLCVAKLKSHPKYKNNKKLYLIKLEAIKNKFVDSFLEKEVKKIKITMSIKNNLINEYWKKKGGYEKYTENYIKLPNDYEHLMMELDLLLKTKPSCDCRNTGFGFCFHQFKNITY